MIVKTSMKRNQLINKIILCFFLFLFVACDNDMYGSREEPNDQLSDTGQITFSVIWEDTEANGDDRKIQALDCNNIDSVQAAIFDSTNTKQKSDSWPCTAHEGTLKEVPAGDNKTIVIYGKKTNGDILFRGQRTGVNVVKNQTTDIIEPIVAKQFSPVVSINSSDDTIIISWEAVDGALSYNIYWSANPNISKDTGTLISNTTSPYTHSGLDACTTYYYAVSAKDSSSESTLSNEINATTELGDTGSIYAGSYSGTFSGALPGTLSFTVDDCGNVNDLKAISSMATLTGEGSVDEDGNFFAETSYGGMMNGIINDQYVVYGDWTVSGVIGTFNAILNNDSPRRLITDSINQPCLIIDDANWRWGECSESLAPFGQDGNYNLLTPDCKATEINGDPVVIDYITGHTWTASDPEAGTVTTFNDAETYCSNLEYANRTDWRLPTRLEYITILDMKGDNGPSHFHPEFGNWPGNTFWWTGTQVPGSSTYYAISGNWSNFYHISNNSPYDMLARCVAENKGPLPEPRQIKLTDARVQDEKTNLQWQIEDQEPRTWLEALEYCENLNLDGFDDWRLPSMKELGTLIDDTLTDNVMNEVFIVNYNEIWSSTPARASSANEDWNEIRYIRQSNGTSYIDSFTSLFAVRCVRDVN